jgi:hypothetical protein
LIVPAIPTIAGRAAVVLAAALSAQLVAAQTSPPRAPATRPTPAESAEDHPLLTMPYAELRPRLRRCADEWTRMKRAGETTGLLWSDFSRDCLEHGK